MKTYVYLIHDGRAYKIGKSADPVGRLKDIKTSNPSCVLIAYSHKVNEKDMHHAFRHKRTQGEWFDLSDDDVLQIRFYFKHGIPEQAPASSDLHKTNETELVKAINEWFNEVDFSTPNFLSRNIVARALKENLVKVAHWKNAPRGRNRPRQTIKQILQQFIPKSAPKPSPIEDDISDRF
jgi:hypothetical protein